LRRQLNVETGRVLQFDGVRAARLTWSSATRRSVSIDAATLDLRVGPCF
jgi:hypothetical protein